ncbi:MAG: type IV toxin-antitoxin system AbiEi family antitoxin domain-containing protein [Solirubrobacterales bacterium]
MEVTPAAGRMAALAELQHGVVSRTQLIALGLPSTTIVRWVRVGHLHAVHRGVYSVGHTRLSREGLWMAAVLACGERATLSHIPAARFTHLDRARGRGPIHVTIPRSRRANPRGVKVHRPRRLADVDRMFRGQLPVTTQTRTIFDLAAILRPKDLRERFDQAEYLEDLDHERLRSLVTENPNHRGNGELRRLLDMPYVPLSRTRSKLERVVLRVCRDHELPLPEMDAPFLDYELDFHWPDAHFVVEADGGQHTGEQRDKDNARDIAVLRAGELVRRYGEGPLQDEAAVASEIREILLERLPPGSISTGSGRK